MFPFMRKKRWSYDLANDKEIEASDEDKTSVPKRSSFKYFGLGSSPPNEPKRCDAQTNDQLNQENKEISTEKQVLKECINEEENIEHKKNSEEISETDQCLETESQSESLSEKKSENVENEQNAQNTENAQKNAVDKSENTEQLTGVKNKPRPSLLDEVLAETESLNTSSNDLKENEEVFKD